MRAKENKNSRKELGTLARVIRTMFLSKMTYQEFLESKIELAQDSGFEVNPADINKALKPHQRDAVIWALKGGRRAFV